MKKFVLTMIAALGLTAFTVSAQSCKSDKKYNPQQFTEFAFEGILLEPAQQARIDSLNLAVAANTDSVGVRCRQGRPERGRGGDAGCRRACPADSGAVAAIPAPKCRKACPADSAACAGRPAPQCRRGKVEGGCPGKDGARDPRFRNFAKAGVPRCYVEKVMEILTPDQFEMFVENVSQLPEGVTFGKAPGKPNDKAARQGRPAKGARGGRGACGATPTSATTAN